MIYDLGRLAGETTRPQIGLFSDVTQTSVSSGIGWRFLTLCLESKFSCLTFKALSDSVGSSGTAIEGLTWHLFEVPMSSHT